MKVDLSPSELGIIVHSLQEVCSSGSNEQLLARQLIDDLYDEFDVPGFFEFWLDEYDIDDQL